MKNLSTTQKVLVILGVILLIALIIAGVNKYKKNKKEEEIENVQNKINQLIREKKLVENVSGDQLAASIREKLLSQPVSEVGVKFYQP